MFYTNFIQRLFRSQKASGMFLLKLSGIQRYFTGKKNEEKCFQLSIFFSLKLQNMYIKIYFKNV